MTVQNEFNLLLVDISSGFTQIGTSHRKIKYMMADGNGHRCGTVADVVVNHISMEQNISG